MKRLIQTSIFNCQINSCLMIESFICCRFGSFKKVIWWIPFVAFCLFKHIDFSGKKSTESVPNTVYIAVYTGSCMALFTSTQLTPHVGGKFFFTILKRVSQYALLCGMRTTCLANLHNVGYIRFWVAGSLSFCIDDQNRSIRSPISY